MPFKDVFQFHWPGWKRFSYDFLIIQTGFALFGLSIDLMVQANLGLGPWDVFQMALTYHFPITLGEANIVVAVVVTVLDAVVRERLGWGTLANMIFIGVWIDVCKPIVPAIHSSIIVQLAYLLGGTLLMGFATAIYVGVNAGAGPRDSLMLAITRLGKTSLRKARTLIEVTVAIIGWVLGGPLWIGTIVSALLIGPCVQLAFKVLKVPARREVVEYD